MKQRAKELKAAKADVESDMLAKIAEIPEPDRVMAERLQRDRARIRTGSPLSIKGLVPPRCRRRRRRPFLRD